MSTWDTIRGYASLGADINKRKLDKDLENQEGIVSDKLPELNLTLDDEQIISLSDKWEKSWQDSPKRADWQRHIKENENYWLGKQYDNLALDKNRPMVDNLIFESLETYLPQTTRRNPEPLVSIHSSSKTDQPNPKHDHYIEKVKNVLTDLADENKIRLKLKKAARHWSIYHLGIAKFGWDLDKDIPTMRVIRPKRVILDPDATIDEDGYTGDRIGEYRKLKASTILAIIGDGEKTQKAKEAIDKLTKGDNATEINFIEWWTPQYMFWKLGKTVLLKKQNPHWNYDSEEDETSVDDFGNETPVTNEIKGINHFPIPKMPYIFLSVFNLGDQPMDNTSLITQNLSNQDLINKRNKQIDKNADSMNGGMVVSLGRSGLTQSQARSVTTALRKGGTVVIPDGSPREAIDRMSAPSLPNDIYNQLLDTRERLRDIFGTSGSTPAGVRSEDTVRGKIMSRSLDTDRIGGGVSEYLEQFADDIYNWFVQLLYVYDTAFQFVEGAEPPKLIISVKEGSLLPKDSISIANQALELASMGRISNIDLYKRLEYPNPDELAANVWLETNAPHLLYKDNPMVQEAIAQQQQMAQLESEREMQIEQSKQTAQAGGKMVEDVAETTGSILEEIPTNPV